MSDHNAKKGFACRDSISSPFPLMLLNWGIFMNCSVLAALQGLAMLGLFCELGVLVVRFLIGAHTSRWRRIIDSPVVEEAVDELTRAVIHEFVTGLWFSLITPDQEAPEELRILLNGVIAEVAQRAKRVNLITLLSKYASANPSILCSGVEFNISYYH
jgi:hypothetical protein